MELIVIFAFCMTNSSMNRFILVLAAVLMSLQAWGQGSFKILVRSDGSSIKEAVDAAVNSALVPCRALLPDSVNVDFSKAITGHRTIRSGFSGGCAFSCVLVTFSMEIRRTVG